MSLELEPFKRACFAEYVELAVKFGRNYVEADAAECEDVASELAEDFSPEAVRSHALASARATVAHRVAKLSDREIRSEFLGYSRRKPRRIL